MVRNYPNFGGVIKNNYQEPMDPHCVLVVACSARCDLVQWAGIFSVCMIYML